MTIPFTLADYHDLIERLLEVGYSTTSFANAEPDQRHLVLRHDIDMSPTAALQMARLENDMGFSATYFVLARSDLYNVLAPKHSASLMAIAELGHEIGLHLDASLYGSDVDNIDAAAASECTFLEAALDLSIKTISFHRPAKSLLGYPGRLAGRRHSYEPRFFSEMGYCSDSRGGWEHGHPLAHTAVAQRRALQLLTHPIWWVGEGNSPSEKLRGFLEQRVRELDEELAEQCEVHQTGALFGTAQ